MKLELNSSSPEQTKKTAKLIGRHLKGGEVIELTSDLGGGKTTFVAGLAAGIGSKDQTSSPSFTISKFYKGNKINIKHFDFYRLNDAGVIAYELVEGGSNPGTVTVVEWGGIVERLLPKKRMQIEFVVDGDNSRRLILNFPKELTYLTKDL